MSSKFDLPRIRNELEAEARRCHGQLLTRAQAEHCKQALELHVCKFGCAALHFFQQGCCFMPGEIISQRELLLESLHDIPSHGDIVFTFSRDTGGGTVPGSRDNTAWEKKGPRSASIRAQVQMRAVSCPCGHATYLPAQHEHSCSAYFNCMWCLDDRKIQ